MWSARCCSKFGSYGDDFLAFVVIDVDIVDSVRRLDDVDGLELIVYATAFGSECYDAISLWLMNLEKDVIPFVGGSDLDHHALKTGQYFDDTRQQVV